ncbi:hypothetical protein B0T18DRAFT_447593 [Schizothecium vesticola]|uniref:Uncharacterized protein n=1 Tax=Schizothecium vesticola TaxID=314040 RepID=A0AA40ENN9_9PEZI|nr:hypothetical protein B0T18DRAFT_447593 [Schizothecium vesticola]
MGNCCSRKKPVTSTRQHAETAPLPPTTEEKQLAIVNRIKNQISIGNTNLVDVSEEDQSSPAADKFQDFDSWMFRRRLRVQIRIIRHCTTGNGKNWARLDVESDSDAEYLHSDLSRRRNVSRYKQELSLCYLIDPLIFQTSATPDVFRAAVSPTGMAGSLCGKLAKFETGSSDPIVATIGGLLRNATDGRLWAMTAKHAPRPRAQTPKLLPSEIDPNEYDINAIEPLYRVEKKPRQAKPAGVAPVRFTFAEELPIPDLECRLVSLDSPDLVLPNEFTLQPGGASQALETRIEPKPRAGRVAVLAGASGCHFMTLLRNEMKLRLPSGFTTVWALEPEGHALVRIQAGDSGSWVVDPIRKSVYGMVIASTSHTVYLVPLHNVVKRLAETGDGGSWSLASAEDVEDKKRPHQKDVVEEAYEEDTPASGKGHAGKTYQFTTEIETETTMTVRQTQKMTTTVTVHHQNQSVDDIFKNLPSAKRRQQSGQGASEPQQNIKYQAEHKHQQKSPLSAIQEAPPQVPLSWQDNPGDATTKTRGAAAGDTSFQITGLEAPSRANRERRSRTKGSR